MTDKKKKIPLQAIIGLGRVVDIELKKNSRGAVLILSGVVSISEYSDDKVELLTHSGRINLFGAGLTLSTMEDRSVEVYGRIDGLEMAYGRRRRN